MPLEKRGNVCYNIEKSGGVFDLKKKQGFVQGALILAAASLIVKIIGAVYKIPLRRFILDAEGIGLYNSAYTIYNVLFIIATAGIPVAISKMVAESLAKENYKETVKIYNVSKILLTVIGFIGSSVMFFGAGVFSQLISAPSAKYSIMALAPSLFFVCIMSAYRGFNQGLSNMLPTAVSEIMESSGKLVLGLVLAYLMLPFGKKFSAAGAILGVSTGTFIGAAYLFIHNRNNKKELKNLIKNNAEQKQRSTNEIIKRLLTLAIPITIGSTVFTLATVIDLGMIMNQLKSLGYDEATRVQMYGYYASDAVTMFNMPTTIISTLGVSLVPAIAGAMALNNKREARRTAETALRLTIMLAAPCAVGMSVLSEPILNLAYGDVGATNILKILSLGIIFLSLVMITNSILQSMGKVWIPIGNMAVGAVIKIFVNYMLVGNPQIHINGAPVGTVLCYAVTSILNLIALRKTLKPDMEISFIIKEIIVTGVMGVSAYALYEAVRSIDYKIALLLAVAVAVGVYFSGLIILKAIRKEDVDSMPGAEKIHKIIGRFL